MLYQLPNGKVIHLSIDQYLSLTDEDIQYLISIDYGNVIHSPWVDSSISSGNKKHIDEDNENDESIDFQFESDELHITNEQPMSDQETIDNLEAPDPNFSE